MIGRKIYYDKITGEVLLTIGEKTGVWIRDTTFQEDVDTYKVLKDRELFSFDFLKLEFGDYAQDFVECISYRVNPETKTLEFSYNDPNEPALEQPYQEPLSEKVKQLELAQSVTDTTLLELMESLLQ